MEGNEKLTKQLLDIIKEIENNRYSNKIGCLSIKEMEEYRNIKMLILNIFSGKTSKIAKEILNSLICDITKIEEGTKL